MSGKMLSNQKQKAINLRKSGMSYSQIKEHVPVSKSTLSLWLRNLPLSQEKIDQLRTSDSKIRKYKNTMRLKAQNRIDKAKEGASKNLMPLSSRELHLLGLFLYLGEGKKGYKEALSISNSNPDIIRFAYYWMTSVLGVTKDKLRISLHLYSDMDPIFELQYWSNILDLPLNQFYKPYIKNTKLRQRTHKGFGHGTCNISVCDVRLKEEILVSIDVIINSIKN